MLISDWSSDVCAADLWEPCAGRGTMARPLGESGAVIFTSDRHDYGAPLDRFGSFLDLEPATVAGGGVDWIVTNPPFAQADAMWLHAWEHARVGVARSEEHTSELQSLMRISYAVFCL